MPEMSTAPHSPPPDVHAVMSLLGQHVPLSLLLDLTPPAGPASVDILQAEGRPAVAWWEPYGA